MCSVRGILSALNVSGMLYFILAYFFFYVVRVVWSIVRVWLARMTTAVDARVLCGFWR